MNTPIHTSEPFFLQEVGTSPGNSSNLCLPIIFDQETLAFHGVNTDDAEIVEENDLQIDQEENAPIAEMETNNKTTAVEISIAPIQNKSSQGSSKEVNAAVVPAYRGSYFYNDNANEDSEEEEFEEDEEEFMFYMDELEDGSLRPRSRRPPATNPEDKTARSISAITNCPISIKWLTDNFEYAPGKSLPRGFVYDQYVVLCDEHSLDPVNAASFGKLIRCVFPGLKTRRLGTRGNSKYHYNGVYLKSDSVLHALLNHVKTQQGLTYDSTGKRGRRMKSNGYNNKSSFAMREGGGGHRSNGDAMPKKVYHEKPQEITELTPEEYLGPMPEMERAFVEMSLDSGKLLAGITSEDISTFQFIYHEHCKAIVLSFSQIDLNGVGNEWRRFWRIKVSESAEQSKNGLIYKSIMPKVKLFKICTLETTQEYVKAMDLWTYQLVIDILFPLMTDVMPLQIVNAMRNFISSAVFTLYKILEGYPLLISSEKIRCLFTFCTMWAEFSAVNRMVKTISLNLRNEDSIKAMRSELVRAMQLSKLESEVNIALTPTTWSMVMGLTIDFMQKLEDPMDQSVSGWVCWIEEVVEKMVQETYRELSMKERANKSNCIKFWKLTSDKILGAVMRGTAVSCGVFRTLLIFCDVYVNLTYTIYSSRMDGYHLVSFYYYQTCFTKANRIIQKLIPDMQPSTSTPRQQEPIASTSAAAAARSSYVLKLNQNLSASHESLKSRLSSEGLNVVHVQPAESKESVDARPAPDAAKNREVEVEEHPVPMIQLNLEIEQEIANTEVPTTSQNEAQTSKLLNQGIELQFKDGDEDKIVMVPITDKDGTQYIYLDYDMLTNPQIISFLDECKVKKSDICPAPDTDCELPNQSTTVEAS